MLPVNRGEFRKRITSRRFCSRGGDFQSVLEGYNSTVFVYGQTGCGKSFTMDGTRPENGRLTGSEKGIIPRAIEHIFEAISVTPGVKYLALASYLEIYNEQIRYLHVSAWNLEHPVHAVAFFRDLLIPCEKLRNSSPLALKEITNEGVVVSGRSVEKSGPEMWVAIFYSEQIL